MRWLKKAARLMGRVLYVFLLVTVSVCVPVLPIVFHQKKWRDRETATQLVRRR